MYEIYGHPRTRTFRVFWALEEMGEPYELIEAAPRSDEILAVNPAGKVPALRTGDTVITDSTAILTYLSDKHGKLTAPAGTLERAKQDAWMHRVLDEVDAVLWTAARHSFILPEERRVAAVKDSLKWEFARNLDRMAQDIDGPFLTGDEMTIADIILVHCLNWSHNAKFDRAPQALVDYAKRIRAREVFQRAAAHIKQ